ncbi:MAG TPA: energy transducer TonB [Pyrinomonadaceae bacterium]|jgi:protein TonB|nr:energy transducer TonB [Pyrinomonadaceae bacterium]
MHFRRLHLVLGMLLLAALPLAAQGQKSGEAWTEWETLSPENEEFTVSMPKNITPESTTFAYHKMELSARLYLAKSPAGPVLAIASLSGIKSNPAAYTEFARFNSYVDAFKDFFPEKVRPKGTVAKLTLVSSSPFHGYTSRSFKMTIGDLSGSVQAVVTKKRFYAIVSLNTKKDDALEEKFLSSFVVPERQVEQPKVAEQTAQPNAEDPSVVKPDRSQGVPAETDPNQQPGTDNRSDAGVTNPPNTPQPQPNAGAKKGPIAGGVLNGKAIYMPTPEVPGGEASGVVLVSVLVDEQGSVVEARAISGPAHLHNAAVSAARLARFSPTLLMGEPVRVSGTLSYNFSKSN